MAATVDGQELFARRQGQRIKPGSGAAGQNNAFTRSAIRHLHIPLSPCLISSLVNVKDQTLPQRTSFARPLANVSPSSDCAASRAIR
jgi:hypothetical protein